MRLQIFLLTLLTTILFYPGIVLAQTTILQTSQTKNQENYQLPFPGILPDNPLYPLKIVRDKIYGFLLTDIVKKSEFDLLLSDKRMAMSYLLVNKGKMQLAEKTVSKASKYYEKAVNNYFQAEKEGRDVKILRQKLLDAPIRYQELITGFEEGAQDKEKRGFQESLARVIRSRNKILKEQRVQND